DDIEAIEFAHEIIVPPGPAQFAVGYHRQPSIFLQFDRVANGFVFNGGQFGAVGGVLVEKFVAGLFDLIVAQKGADMVGAERRGAVGHSGTPRARRRVLLAIMYTIPNGEGNPLPPRRLSAMYALVNWKRSVRG